MRDLDPPSGLLLVLVRLRQCLLECSFPLAAADSADGLRERDSLVAHLDDYIIPRVLQAGSPLLVVVAGSTGTGKSTLVNSLVGRVVSRAGELRPTTRSAVLVHSPADAGWFDVDRLLPDVERTDHATGNTGALQLVPVDTWPLGLAILDAPDVDSVDQRHRMLTDRLLTTADLWLFVTSAARYADKVSWDYLRAAAARGSAVAVVLDRTQAADAFELTSHLTEMLAARDLGQSRVFSVPESALSVDGLIPAPVVQPIAEWLAELTTDTQERRVVIRTTLEGTVATLSDRVAKVAAALSAQESTATQLRADIVTAYAEALTALWDTTWDAPLLLAEVLACWQELVDAVEPSSVHGRMGRIRGRLRSSARSRSIAERGLADARELEASKLILEYADNAAASVARAWRANPAGEQLLAASGADDGRRIRELARDVQGLVAGWREGVVDLVRTESGDRARLGNNHPGATSVDAGEIGDDTLQRVAELARADLSRRVDTLWDVERAGFFAVLDGQPLVKGVERRLRLLAREIEDLRLVGDLV